MADIFISYAREDRPKIKPLVETLEDLGWSVFWDRTIPTGRTWRQVIGEALETASSVIVAWSKSSVESSWVQEEADRGRERNILVPILIDNVKPPLGFGAIQTADLISWEPTQSSTEFEKFIDDISAILGPSSRETKKTERIEIEEKEHRREQTEERQRRKDEQQREEVKHKTEEQTLHKTEVPSKKEAALSNKSMALASRLLPIFIALVVGVVLAIIAIWQSVDWNPVSLALIGVCSWSVIGAICGKDRKAVVFLLVGYFLVAIIWKIFDNGPNSNARAIFYGGGCGALMGAVLGRIVSKFK